jgi:hypothetical protein
MTTMPTREQIENAEALEFTQPKAPKRQRSISIQLNYHGALVTFGFSASDNVPIIELEQSIDTLLRREGWQGVDNAPAPILAGPGKIKAQYVDPLYNDAGEACCPVHRYPLAEGRYGPYCRSRAKDGEAANDKGYCSLRFKG